MGQIATTIVETSSKAVAYAERLLAGVTPAMFARFPVADGKAVATNHPCFVFGHLALYPAKFLENAGLDAASLAVPKRYTDVFSAGVECRDDADGTTYPAMEEVVAHFRKGHADLFARIREMDDAALAAPPALERARAFLPTLGAVGTFYFLGHTMMHLGQVSAWRRMMGLGAA